MSNIDKQEIKKFSDIADEWWNKDGDFKPLHIINPLRANFIKEKTSLDNKKILDVGCGGGLLTEALYDFGADVYSLISFIPNSLGNLDDKSHPFLFFFLFLCSLKRSSGVLEV